jgi:FkbM family methyltransferase
MSWMTNGAVIALRKVGRGLGLNSLIARMLHGNGYETGYDLAFQMSLRPGDCVWDIGANVGHYTRMFSGRVGDQGRVLAFEPSPLNHAKLVDACAGLSNVEIFNFGIGDADGEVIFQQGDDDLGATSRVVSADEAAGMRNAVKVPVRAGDALVKGQVARPPNALKIDVEGFEPEVIRGLENTLRDRGLRSVGIEMHFTLLQARGLPSAPRAIESLLRGHGFTMKWPDSSHLLAFRED